MLAWIETHTSALQVVVGLTTALVWVIYLHILVSGLRRQRRSEILITLAGKRDMSGRVMVSNLGFEPIYILDILLRLSADHREDTVSVAERGKQDERGEDPSDKPTLQTPLKTGDLVDIGEIATLLDRAGRGFSDSPVADALSRIDITVVAVTAATSSIVAAQRSFDVEQGGDGPDRLRPQSLYARQIRSRRERRSIEQDMQRNL
ncbi:MAG: hypothetical protein CL949_08910 [Erythrobacter sp.]|nr:hypothetical protein [Erythrobacter sp.]